MEAVVETTRAGEETATAQFVPIEVDDEPKVESAPVNGHHVEEEEDDINNEDLTPPPDSPVDETLDDTLDEPVGDPADNSLVEVVDDAIDDPADDPVDDTLSHTSSPQVNILEDEIVVGTKSNSNNTNMKSLSKSPLPPAASETEDVEMIEPEEQAPVALYPKRKRTANYTNLSDDKIDFAVRPEPDARAKQLRPAKTHGMGGVKGVVLGFWRDSEPEDDKDKHSVIGFIDVRDRLRTRIQPTTRDGRNITQEYPLPPGPGGSWVTFEKVAFDPPLVNLDHYQIKEFVKIRAESLRKDETPQEKEDLDAIAIKEAIYRVQNNPPPETTVPIAIAYGAQIPEHAQLSNRPEAKKRRLLGYSNSPAGSPSTHVQLENIPGTRPTRILLGYWKQSSEEAAENKHAVYGILGANDMFRVKLMRETRDGRAIIGNFPPGAGALWIHWDEVEFEPHLKHLSRPEIKEYCRVRQRQIDEGETPEARAANEANAVYEAQARVVSSFAPVPKKEDMGNMPAIAMKISPAPNGGSAYEESANNGGNAAPQNLKPTSNRFEGVPHELRQSRRIENGPRGPRHSLPDVELRAANRPQSVDALERTNSIARREVERIELAQSRADQRAVSREAAGGGTNSTMSNRGLFQDNMSRLNKVWVAQEANRIKGGAEDAKIYMGVKYERKQGGPFEGKLVSQGTIISIDGEDYVEYRVLTKPSFF
ncbi:hypothetical protein B0T22DRAFT_483575 [Podospora appendiculata]|uniref:Uncharacterized protein n=1 Tax=Podospora appendiculata TaxID=314037 RepID=A0AAE1C949_9PEZI|nr:hypothetical protein B0T22DRAFT_483575 [Podospora appendiculata]